MNHGLEAFSQTVSIHQDRVYALALAILRDADDAADITQEAFLRLWRKGRDLPPEVVQSWLLKVAHNLCLDHLRRLRIQQKRLGRPDPEALQSLATPAPSAAAHLLPENLHQALSALTPRTRSMVVLHYCEGFKLAEIASLLETNLGSVKARLHRARKSMRLALEPGSEAENPKQETGT